MNSTDKARQPVDKAVCPKCGYRAQGLQDPILTRGECPACGIIVEKFLRRRQELAAPAIPAAGPDTDQPPEPPPATFRRRISAALYTLMEVLCITAVLQAIKLPIIMYRYPPSSLKTWQQALAASDWERGFNAFSVLAPMLLITLYQMLSSGSTRGQRRLAIGLASADSSAVPNMLQIWLLRCAGYLATILTLGLVQYFRKDRASLADLFSKTRQIEPDEPFPRRDPAFRPFFILIAIMAASAPLKTGFIKYYASPGEKKQEPASAPSAAPAAPGPARQAAGIKQKESIKFNAPMIVFRIEQKHYEEQGRYSDDIRELIATNRGSTVNLDLLDLADSGELIIKLTATGFTASVKLGENQWRTFSEKGFQGNLASP